MSRLHLAPAILVVILSSSAPAEVQVNVRTSDAQANPTIALDPNGGAIVAWSSYYSTAGRSHDILARRLDATGLPMGDEFIVNTIKEGSQAEPGVATDPQGRLAVVWQGAGTQEDVFLRVYDSRGIPLTDDLLVNLATAGRQLYPCITTGDAGVFLVAWESRETAADQDHAFVYAHRFDPNGAGLGGDILVDPNKYDCRYPDVAVDARGNFAVVWLRDRSIHPIMARLFDPNGVPRTDVFTVNTTSIASVTRPSVAMNALGYFVIAWDGDPNAAAHDDIHARLYDPNGTPRGEPFVVNTIRAGAQQWPQAAINDANEFVIVWEHNSDDPSTGADIFARRFDADGQPTGEETRLNAHTLDKQRYADVAMASDGSFFAVWESNNQDGSGYGVFAHFEPPTNP
ncbi:MAG TPA: hypothetical protein PKH24_11065 [Sedimentisphaerales bacterium]|jgi:hypothetical protein|nr:hypothetical protein [Sedimentisphaerales bacterium]HNU29829.1 hypothetical protein [Sedimentisphaerales bacterium]